MGDEQPVSPGNHSVSCPAILQLLRTPHAACVPAVPCHAAQTLWHVHSRGPRQGATRCVSLLQAPADSPPTVCLFPSFAGTSRGMRSTSSTSSRGCSWQPHTARRPSTSCPTRCRRCFIHFWAPDCKLKNFTWLRGMLNNGVSTLPLSAGHRPPAAQAGCRNAKAARPAGRGAWAATPASAPSRPACAARPPAGPHRL